MNWKQSIIASSLALTVPATIAARAPKLKPTLPKPPIVYVENDKGEALLGADAANLRVDPASLAKLMTIYNTFEDLEAGKFSLDDKAAFQAKDAAIERNLGLTEGSELNVHQLILAALIYSANDATVVLARKSEGSVEKFVEDRMNKTAARLGMNNTHFKGPHGLPDRDQYTTARDIAILTRALKVDFPQYAYLFEEKSFTYTGHINSGALKKLIDGNCEITSQGKTYNKKSLPKLVSARLGSSQISTGKCSPHDFVRDTPGLGAFDTTVGVIKTGSINNCKNIAGNFVMEVQGRVLEFTMAALRYTSVPARTQSVFDTLRRVRSRFLQEPQRPQMTTPVLKDTGAVPDLK